MYVCGLSLFLTFVFLDNRFICCRLKNILGSWKAGILGRLETQIQNNKTSSSPWYHYDDTVVGSKSFDWFQVVRSFAGKWFWVIWIDSIGCAVYGQEVGRMYRGSEDQPIGAQFPAMIIRNDKNLKTNERIYEWMGKIHKGVDEWMNDWINETNERKREGTKHEWDAWHHVIWFTCEISYLFKQFWFKKDRDVQCLFPGIVFLRTSMISPHKHNDFASRVVIFLLKNHDFPYANHGLFNSLNVIFHRENMVSIENSWVSIKKPWFSYVNSWSVDGT